MFSAVTVPKFPSSGKSLNASTAKPPITVSPDDIIARPIRNDAFDIASRGASPLPRSSKYLLMSRTLNSVPIAMISGPEIDVSGLYSMPLK